jgi:drug/metabolite transporter (DMT)-like permease
MLGVALAFVSSIFWGASDFAGGVSSRRATALSATLWSFVAATAASALAIVIFPGTWSQTALVAGAAAGVLGLCGFLTLYAALASAPMGVVTVIVGAVEAIVPVVVGVFWYHEALSVLAWSGIAIALIGAAIIGWAESATAEDGAGAKAALGPLALATASGALFGFSVVALDTAPDDSGFITPAFEVAIGLALLGLLVWAVARVRAVRRLGDALSITTGTSPAPRRAVQIGLAAGVFLAVANITLLMALREAPLAIVGVVLCLYPVTTAILARVFLHERLTAKHLAGIGVALAGCVILAVG